MDPKFEKNSPLFWIFYQDTGYLKFFKNMLVHLYNENLSDNVSFVVTFIGLITLTLAYISTFKYFVFIISFLSFHWMKSCREHSVHPPPFSVGRGGWTSNQMLKRRGPWQDINFQRGFLEKRSVTFSWGGLQFSHEK